MKTVFLTGANGFLGGHVCRELLRRNYAVRAFVRPDSDVRALTGLPVDVWTGDLRDAASVRGAVCGCDYVIHAGAMAQVNPARNKAVVEINVGGTAAVLAAAQRAGSERIVYVGSANVFGFGTKEQPGNETSPYMGLRYGLDYMDSKRAASDLVAAAVRQDGLPAVQVHPTFMLGPLDYKITSNALLLALFRGEMAGIPTGGKNYVHVADVATATVNALTMGRVGESYIAGNENLSYREAFTQFAHWMGIRPPTLRVPPALANAIGQLSEWKQTITGTGRLNKAMTAVANDGHYFDVTKARHELHLPKRPSNLPLNKRSTGSASTTPPDSIAFPDVTVPSRGLTPTAARPKRQFFTDKVVVITGSESGIGRETARQFGEQGAHLVLNGLNADRLNQTEHTFRAAGYSVVSCVADVTDYDQCETLIDAAVRAFGRIDVLITNASISMRAYFADLTPDAFKRVMDSNIYGSVFPLKAALPYLTQSAGSVTFISSISALNGMPSGSAYCAGKAALANLAHTIRLELYQSGIHFGVVHIGFTENDADKRVLDATGQPVPIAYRNPKYQMPRQDVSRAILRHIQKRRRRTILSPTGFLILFVHGLSPRLADAIIRWSMRHWSRFYE